MGGGAPPAEVVEYIMCSEIWPGVTPSQLDREDEGRVMAAWIIHNQRQQVRGAQGGRLHADARGKTWHEIQLELEAKDKGATAAVDKLRKEVDALDKTVDGADFGKLAEEAARSGTDFRTLEGAIDDYVGALRAATPENAKLTAAMGMVTTAFEKGEISADEAADELERLRAQMVKTSQGADGAKRGLSGFVTSLTDIKAESIWQLEHLTNCRRQFKRCTSLAKLAPSWSMPGLNLTVYRKVSEQPADCFLGSFEPPRGEH